MGKVARSSYTHREGAGVGKWQEVAIHREGAGWGK